MGKKLIIYINIIAIYGVLTTLYGCATVSKKAIPYQRKSIPKIGIYHKVKKGETLWRISKVYGVNLEEIVKVNRLSDATKISVDQLIFIPGATQQKSIILDQLKKTNSNFIWPVKGKVISYFGAKKEGHLINKGIDIQAPENSLVIASRGGKISFCSEKVKGFGKTIIIDHGDGYSSVYAHNSEILVEVGEVVEQGQTIGKVGSTGRAELPFLHFEIRKEHIPQNPFYFLP